MKAKYLLAIVYLIIAGLQKRNSKIIIDLQGTWEVSSRGAWNGHQEYDTGNGSTFSFVLFELNCNECNAAPICGTYKLLYFYIRLLYKQAYNLYY
jgi:hypothetical protein